MKLGFKNRILSFILVLVLALSLSLTSCDVISGFMGDSPSLGDTVGGDSENGDLGSGENDDAAGGNTGSNSGDNEDNSEANKGETENNTGNNNGDSSDKNDGGSSQNPEGSDGKDTVTEVEPAEDVYLEKYGNIKIPAYKNGVEYYVVNNNVPFFTESEIVTKSYERYDERDSLGRCTETMACLGKDLMPTESRGSISSVKPTGWIQAQYDCINTRDLYNRCHLIGWQLTGENANWENLVTGTRFMNEAMIPFENMIADYIKETNNHVMYRVTPIFIGDNLVCAGILMEAYSVEDDGEGITFNVFVYNNQPGVGIDYKTGASWRLGAEEEEDDEPVICDYVLNKSSKKIHKPGCSNVDKMADKNREDYTGDIDDLLEEGYTKAGCCNPD